MTVNEGTEQYNLAEAVDKLKELHTSAEGLVKALPEWQENLNAANALQAAKMARKAADFKFAMGKITIASAKARLGKCGGAGGGSGRNALRCESGREMVEGHGSQRLGVGGGDRDALSDDSRRQLWRGMARHQAEPPEPPECPQQSCGQDVGATVPRP